MMMDIRTVFLIMTLGLALLLPPVLPATEEGDKRDQTPGRGLDRVSIEYYLPLDADRNIRTLNVNGYSRIREFAAVKMTLHGVLTATYASGDITQVADEFSEEEETYPEVHYTNEAFGIGPGILGEVSLWRRGRFSLDLAGSGSIIFYTQRFPAGGELYNFMWRGGPACRYELTHNQGISLGYKWMHVSNGQGVGPHNPSYDAHGLSFFFSNRF
ncbi:hypothetical protein ACFL6N_08145 [Thermodesulfobacteriota bacterium]